VDQQQKSHAIAILDQRYLVLTSAGAPINQVIDTFKGKPSVAQTPRFAEAMREIQERRPLAEIYVNMPAATAQMAASRDQPLAPEIAVRVQEVRGLATTITLEDHTLNFKTISWLDPDAKQKLKVENKASNLAQYLPADTLIMASGGNFQDLWTAYIQGTPAQLVLPFNFQEWAKQFSESTGIDFDKTFVPWMNREFTGAVVPVAENKPEASPGAGLVFLVKTSDRTATTLAFQQLDDAVRDRFDFQIAESNLDKTPVISWRVPPGLPVADHGWLSHDLPFLTLGTPMATRLIPAPQERLADQKRFRTALKSQLKPHNGQFFVDMNPTLEWMQANPLLPKLAPNTLTFAEAIESIGMTTAIRNSWSTRYDIRVILKE
jgi:hypothetical protein